MNIDEVYYSIHNLDVRDALRRFQPKYSVLVVSPRGDVVVLEKYKKVPEFSEIGVLLQEHKGCGAFIASAEMYPTKEELQERVESMVLKLRNVEADKPIGKKGLLGTTYYGGPK